MSQQKTITIRIDAETYNQLRHKLLDQKKSFSQWVREQMEVENETGESMGRVEKLISKFKDKKYGATEQKVEKEVK